MAPDQAPASLPAEQVTRFWSLHRRWLLLAGLTLGLSLFFIWLPGPARTALWAALQAQQTLIGLFGLLALLVLSLLWSAGERLDIRIFLFLNQRGYRSRWLDRGLWLATQLGNVAAAFVLAGLLWGLNDRRLAVEMLLGTLTLGLLVETLKTLLGRERPFLNLTQTRIVGGRERGRSFPSGHTAQVFFLLTLLVYRFQPELGGLLGLAAVAGLVGFTRVYVGAHYPRDVLAGAALGAIWGMLTVLIDPYWSGYHF